MEHPTIETLINFAENQLPESEQALVKEHLSGSCQQCSAFLIRMRRLLDAAKNEGVFTPPDAELRKAIAAFKKRGSARQETRKPILASLFFDSRTRPSLAAVRGAQSGRQVLFKAGQYDIDLQIVPEHGDTRLVGQVLGSDQLEEGLSVFVSLNDQNGEVIQGAESDRHGQFAFRKLQPGRYDLVFDLQDQEVAIKSLELGDDK